MLKNTKNHTHTLLELTNQFFKELTSKINMQKSLAFLYTSHKQSKYNIKKTISFTIASEMIKYLEIKLTKEVQNLGYESYNFFERICLR